MAVEIVEVKDKEQSVKKRGWVKNAAIAFLAVMLALTFFSNTIMNRALPEVAAQYAMSGSINARIRGTGTIAANDSFEVVLNQTRTVTEVNVRLGHEVEVGDLLFTLAGAGSAELDTARAALDALLLSYERMVINASLDGNYSRENRDIRIARETVDEARAALNAIPYSAAEIASARATVDFLRAESSHAETRIETAEIAVEYATTARNSARDTRDDAHTARASAQTAVTSAQGTVETRTAAVRVAQNALDNQGGANLMEIDHQISLRTQERNANRADRAAAWLVHGTAYTALENELAIPEMIDDGLVQNEQQARLHPMFPVYKAAAAQRLPATHGYRIAYEIITGFDEDLTMIDNALALLQQQRQNILSGHSVDRDQLIRALNEANAALAAAQAALTGANAELTNAQWALTSTESMLTAAEAALTQANAELTSAERAFADAGRDIAAAEAALELQLGYRTAWQTANESVRTLQTTLENMVFDLSETQRRDGVDNALSALERRDLRDQIDRKRDEIANLEEDDAGGTILSPVSGIVRAINISPGNPTQSGQPLAVIEVVDRGFSLSFPVTLDQSRRVAIGDSAEVTRGWWGGDEITAVLTNIRNDPQNPATSRILEFDVSGDVESGAQVNITIGQRSQNFEVIVPNSAIRSDTNGDFVLVVMSRPSPLGNRFIATRVDVMVLASDDTSTAVTGGLSNWGDFVITRSSSPIEPGMQVRLVDNP
ncbi:MAG: HlyD family efflux transporter periplasmic adaptor subunit [Oscillospiraceae bacterium]|nr:HlyD family efflux transporter periplasmic adaptor subunit [Oscillospiraceae bacterium]